MATMATETTLQNGPSRIERLSPEDFETASIRSAAPSYISEAPSYHSTLPTNESVPAYTPREPTTTTAAAPSPPRYAPSSSNSMLNLSSTPTPMTSTFAPGAGLPPRLPSPRRDVVPRLSHFQIPSWSSMASNPTARHYQRVAHRRVSAAAASNAGRWGSGVESALRSAVERINANAAAAAAAAAADDPDDPDKVRPLEDPYLVGEEAAARARRERLARQNGDEVLYREERRWDWFLGQTRDWDERNRSWGAFSTTIDNRGRLARRFGR